LHGLITLQRKIDTQHIPATRWYGKDPIPEIPIPILGPDIFDPRENAAIRQFTAEKLAAQQSAEAAMAVADAAADDPAA